MERERERGFTGDEGEEAGVCNGEGSHGKTEEGVPRATMLSHPSPSDTYDRCVGIEKNLTGPRVGLLIQA